MSTTSDLIGAGMDPLPASIIGSTSLSTSVADFRLTNSTADGADTGSVGLGGGGTSNVTRGASFVVYGNEATSNNGAVKLILGSVSGSKLTIALTDTASTAIVTDGTNTLWTYTAAGALISTTASAGLQLKSATTLTAAGTTITDALQLTATYNNVTTAAANTGVKLWNPASGVGTVIVVRNGGASNLKVYPANTSGTINGGSAGANITLATSGAHIGTFQYVAADTWIASDSASAA